MASIDITVWAPIVATFILAGGTLAFAYWQLRQAGRLHSASTLLDLRERYYSDRMRHARRELAAWLMSSERGAEPDSWEVGLFFEQMGYLTRTGVLEARMVWNAFGNWITAYWALMIHPEDLITKWRTETGDPAIFREFEWLATRMRELDHKLHAVTPASRSPLVDARETLDYEMHVEGPNGPPLARH